MSQIKYSPELKEQVLKEYEQCADAKLVAEKFSIPPHAVYRFRRDALKAPEVSKDQEIKRLNKQLKESDLENKILRELLKKTYQVMPIDEK